MPFMGPPAAFCPFGDMLDGDDMEVEYRPEEVP
jgi:hypothetical protein